MQNSLSMTNQERITLYLRDLDDWVLEGKIRSIETPYGFRIEAIDTSERVAIIRLWLKGRASNVRGNLSLTTRHGMSILGAESFVQTGVRQLRMVLGLGFHAKLVGQSSIGAEIRKEGFVPILVTQSHFLEKVQRIKESLYRKNRESKLGNLCLVGVDRLREIGKVALLRFMKGLEGMMNIRNGAKQSLSEMIGLVFGVARGAQRVLRFFYTLTTSNHSPISRNFVLNSQMVGRYV
jgi:hypothetical protein